MVMGVKLQVCSLCHQIRWFVLACAKARLNIAMFEWNVAGLSALVWLVSKLKVTHILYPTLQALLLESSF